MEEMPVNSSTEQLVGILSRTWHVMLHYNHMPLVKYMDIKSTRCKFKKQISVLQGLSANHRLTPNRLK